MPKSYEWLVVRGRVSIHSESSRVVLALDPEGNAYCVFSAQDAVDIAAIIADQAQAIWKASEQSPVAPARVEGDVRNSCKLWAEPGVLEVIAHDSQPLIALIYDSATPCKLDVKRAVALVQILQHMSSEMEARL